MSSSSSISFCSSCPNYFGAEITNARKVLVVVTVATFIIGLLTFAQFPQFDPAVKWLNENPALSGLILGSIFIGGMPIFLYLALKPTPGKNMEPIDEAILEKGGILAQGINFYWTERTAAQRAFLLTLVINIMALSILAQCHIQPIEGIRQGFKCIVEKMDLSAFGLFFLIAVYFLATLNMYFHEHNKFNSKKGPIPT
jgi:hypothetical protein